MTTPVRSFSSEIGTPIGYSNAYTRVLIPTLRKAGICHEREDGEWDNEGIGFHSFRKLAGSGAHSYSAGDATRGSEEAARFKT